MKKGILGALPIVAAAYAERFGVPVNVGGDHAYTDGQAIQIPAIEKSYGNMNVVWGYLAHESAHVKWSDFVTQSSTPFEHQLVNALEDCRIEAAMIREYPGTVTTLGALDEFLIANGCHTIPDATCHPGEVVISTCLFWGMINVVGKQAFQPLMSGTLSVLRESVGDGFGHHLINLLQTHLPQAQSTQDVRDLAAAIIQLMQDELLPEASQLSSANSQQDQTPQGISESQAVQGKGENSEAHEGQSDSASHGPEEDQLSSAGENRGQASDDQPQADGEKGKSNGGSQSERGQESIKPDLPQGNFSSEQGTSITADAAAQESTGGQGIPASTESDPAEQQQAAVQTTDVHSGKQSWLQQALNAGADDLSEDRMQLIRRELDTHEDRDAKYLTVRLAPETAKNEWQGKVLQRAAERVGTRLLHELMGLVQSKARTAHKARDHGRRLDTTRILRVMAGDPRIFRAATERTSPNTAVHLLVDSSGSMGHGNRLDIAETSALALARALNAIKGVNPAVTFFGGITGQPVQSAMRHGQKAVARSAHFAPTAGGGTPMAEAIWYAAYELSKTLERRKMIIVITDGKPNKVPAAKFAIDLAEEAGMEVVGIGIETLVCSQLFSRHIVIDKVDDLCQSLFRLVGDYLISDRAA